MCGCVGVGGRGECVGGCGGVSVWTLSPPQSQDSIQVRGECVGVWEGCVGGGGACGYGEYAWVGGHTCMCVCGWRVNIMLELYIDYTGRFEWLYSHFNSQT